MLRSSKNSPVKCFVRGVQGGEPCRAGTFIANRSRQSINEGIMAFEFKTIKDVYNNIITKYQTLLEDNEKSSPLLPVAVVKTLAAAFSGETFILWQYAKWIQTQCFPQTATWLPAMKMWGSLVGVEYKTGQKTVLELELTNVTASFLSAQTVYKDLSSGYIYKTLSQVQNFDGKITVKAQCSISGENTVLSPGTILQIANPIDGIPQTASVTGIIINGSSDEDKNDYKTRYLYRFRNKPQGGSPVDYLLWATEANGINFAMVYIFEEGIVTVIPVADGSGLNRSPSGDVLPNPFPIWENGNFTELTGSGQMLEVAQKIEGSEIGQHDRRPATAVVKLENIIYHGYCVEISGLSDISFIPEIKQTLINFLDTRKPHIIALNTDENLAKINSFTLSSLIQNSIGNATMQSFILKEQNGEIITGDSVLAVKELAWLSSLTINGISINL